jgi:hypothetical protein
VSATALLEDGAIDDTNKALNKAYSNIKTDELLELKANDNEVVKLIGDQTIDDVKEFLKSPIVPTATNANEAVNKGQLDSSLYTPTPTLAIASTTFTASTNSITFSGLTEEEITNFAKVEIGDVLQFGGAVATKLNSEFTAEVLTSKWANGVSITAGQQRKSIATNITYTASTSGTTSGTDINDDTGVNWEIATSETIIVNQAHASGTTTKSLVNETATITVKLLTKWYNAPIGLGQDWVDVKSIRSAGTTYTNNTNRSFQIALTTLLNGWFSINGVQVQRSDSAAWSQHNLIINKENTYLIQAGLTIDKWQELR